MSDSLLPRILYWGARGEGVNISPRPQERDGPEVFSVISFWNYTEDITELDQQSSSGHIEVKMDSVEMSMGK